MPKLCTDHLESLKRLFSASKTAPVADLHRIKYLRQLRFAVARRNVLLAVPIECFHMYKTARSGESTFIRHPQRCDQFPGFGIALVGSYSLPRILSRLCVG